MHKEVIEEKKLQNELKEFRTILSDYGYEEKHLDDFDKIYKIRSNYAMHAQKGLVSIDIDAVFVLKAFLNSILHKYYFELHN